MIASIRFGINVGGLLKNVAIFVFKVDYKTGQTIIEAVDTIKVALMAIGQKGIADKLVAEWR
jgi:hypothetical protein